MTNIDASVFVPVTRLKGKNECVQSDFLEGYIIQNNHDDRIIDIVVYGTLIFSQSPRYVDATVVDLIEQVDNQVNPIPAIIAETIHSLNYCKRKCKGSFVDSKPLLGQVWSVSQVLHEHYDTNWRILPKKVAKRSDERAVGGSSSRPRPDSRDMKKLLGWTKDLFSTDAEIRCGSLY